MISRADRFVPSHITASLLALLTVGMPSLATADGLVRVDGVGSALAKAIEEGALNQINEVSKRRRLTTFFVNEQSPFYGLQINYVNVRTGNLTFLNRDLVRLDRIPIVFGRVYDSRKALPDDFGPGWRLSVAESIAPNGTGFLYLDSSGSEYELLADGTRIRSPYPHLTGIERGRFTPDGAIELQQGDLVKRFRRIQGRYYLEEVRDRVTNVLRISYIGTRIAQVRSAHGRFVNVQRNSDGRIIQARDDSGRIVTYGYDQAGQLASVDGTTDSGWTMSYAGKGLLSEMTDPRGTTALSALYDENGRATHVTVLHDAMSFDYRTTHTIVETALQQAATFWYDASGLTRSVQDFEGALTDVTFDEELRPTALSFNGGLVAEMSYSSGMLRAVRSLVGGEEKTNIYEYDDQGRLSRVRSNAGLVARYGYDVLGNVVSASDWAGYRKYQYSPLGVVRKVTLDETEIQLIVNAHGLLAAFSGDNYRVGIVYDNRDRVRGLRFVIDGHVYENRYEYGDLGLRTKGEYVPAQEVEIRSAFEYDDVGNLTGLTHVAPDGAITSQTYVIGYKNELQRLITDQEQEISYEYDAAGRAVRTAFEGQVGGFEYDRLGRLTDVYLNGEHMLASEYGPMDVDAATEADDRTAVTTIAAPIASAIFGSLESIAYARTAGTPFGPIRFNSTMSRLVLAEYLLAPPDAVTVASLKRRALPVPDAGHNHYGASTDMVNPSPMGFDKPSNGLFLPPEFSSLNCYQCTSAVFPTAQTLNNAQFMTVNGSSGIAQVTVGQSADFHIDAPGSFSCWLGVWNPWYGAYGWMSQSFNHFVQFGDGTGASPLSSEYDVHVSHAFSSPGIYVVQHVGECRACGIANIFLAALTTTVCARTPYNAPAASTAPAITHQASIGGVGPWGRTNISFDDSSLVCTAQCSGSSTTYRLEGNITVTPASSILVATDVPAVSMCTASPRSQGNITHTDTHEMVHANALLAVINDKKTHLGIEYSSLSECNSALSSLRNSLQSDYAMELANQSGHVDHAGETRHMAYCPAPNGPAAEGLCGQVPGFACPNPPGNTYPGP